MWKPSDTIERSIFKNIEYLKKFIAFNFKEYKHHNLKLKIKQSIINNEFKIANSNFKNNQKLIDELNNIYYNNYIIDFYQIDINHVCLILLSKS
jgi:hypothetical protein